MERVVIEKVVDKCYFCGLWFFQEMLSEIQVAERNYRSETVPKLICCDCLEKIAARSKLANGACVDYETRITKPILLRKSDGSGDDYDVEKSKTK